MGNVSKGLVKVRCVHVNLSQTKAQRKKNVLFTMVKKKKSLLDDVLKVRLLSVWALALPPRIPTSRTQPKKIWQGPI